MVYIPPNVGYWEESLNNANPESTSRVLQESTDIYEDEGNTAYRKYFLGQVRGQGQCRRSYDNPSENEITIGKH